jgi:MGT family glycosyltransferase
MASIAFFAAPFAGHVNPTLGVVTELVARGHRVSYAVPDEFAARVEEAGGRAVRYETSMGSFRTAVAPFGDPDRYTTGALVKVLRGLLDETLTALPALHSAFAADRPDLVVYDPACWAAGQAEGEPHRRGVPRR